MDCVDIFANFLQLQSTIFKFSFFHILSNFYANLTCSPIFENEFKIQIVWSMFESDMTKALDVRELSRQSLQHILATQMHDIYFLRPNHLCLILWSPLYPPERILSSAASSFKRTSGHKVVQMDWRWEPVRKRPVKCD